MLAFVHIAKTGGRSVDSLLRSAYGPAHCDAVLLRPRPPADPSSVEFTIPKYDAADFRRLLDVMPGMRSIGGHHVALWSDLEEVRPEVTYLLFLRDPIRRGASHYQYHLRNDDFSDRFGFKTLPWEDWVRWEVHHNHQVKMIAREGTADAALRQLGRKRVFVGLIERFDESLLMFRKLMMPELKLAYRRENAAPDNSKARALLDDPAKRAQIERMYGEEIPVYEHVRDVLFPRYETEYGPTLQRDLEEFRRRAGRVNRVNLLKYEAYRRLVFAPRLKRLKRTVAAAES